MPRPTGLPKTGGRKKGTRNKLTRDIKEMVLTALELEGGPEYLRKQARNNPSAFLALVGRVIPLQVNGGDDGPILIVTGIARPDDGITVKSVTVRPAPQLGPSPAEPIDVTPSSSKLTH